MNSWSERDILESIVTEIKGGQKKNVADMKLKVIHIAKSSVSVEISRVKLISLNATIVRVANKESLR